MSCSMRNPRSPRPLGFTRAQQVVTALVTMLQMLFVAAAPIAEQPDSRVAAVHVEQAGTSTHHAHGEVCALCAASHLVAPPARAGVVPAFATVATRPGIDRSAPSTAADRLDTRPRAPPA